MLSMFMIVYVYVIGQFQVKLTYLITMYVRMYAYEKIGIFYILYCVFEYTDEFCSNQ